MTRRSVAIHGGLLALALTLAWTVDSGGDRHPAQVERGVLIVDAEGGDAESVTYRQGANLIRLTARHDAHGRWIFGEASDPNEGDSPRQIFAGDKKALALFAALEPFRVQRVLSSVSPEKLAELHLIGPTASLTLQIRGRRHHIALGGSAYGTADRYGRLDDGRVVVLPRALTRGVALGASTYAQRVFFSAPRVEIERLEVRQGEGTLSLVQHASGGQRQTFWAEAGQATGRDEYKTWVDTLLQLTALEYVAERPATEWVLRLSVTADFDGRPRETLRIFEVPNTEPDNAYRAVSDQTRLVARVAGRMTAKLVGDWARLAGEVSR